MPLRSLKRVRQNLRFGVRRPRLLARAAVSVALRLLGQPRLRTLDIDLTYRCPCRCAHCYSDSFHDPARALLAPREIAALVAQAIDLGAVQVSLSGGEPLLRRDLLSVIAVCQPDRVLVSMCSSGVGLDRQRLRALQGAGLGVLVLSLDSAEPIEHDENRRVLGLHESVQRAIGDCQAIGLDVMVNTVATRQKLANGGIHAIVALAERLDVIVNLTVPAPLSRWSAQEHEVLLDAEARRHFFRWLRHPRVRTDADSAYLSPGCPAATEKISIDAYGGARPCQVLPIEFGDVRKTPLAKLWELMREDRALGAMPAFCPAGDREFLEQNRHRYR
jgi:AdoMet-dependent heme synthase